MSRPIDHWTWSDISFAKWRTVVNQRLKEIYAISIADSGVDDDYQRHHWELKQSPYEFVEWFGNKYDLDPVSVFGAGRV